MLVSEVKFGIPIIHHELTARAIDNSYVGNQKGIRY